MKNNQVRILEGLRENFNTDPINEDCGKYLEDNIDKGKYSKIESTANKYGYTFSAFQLHKYAGSGKLSAYVTVANKNYNDKLKPQIVSDNEGGRPNFYVYPSFMGNLTSGDAKKMSKNLLDAASFVDFLNRTDFNEFIVEGE